MGARFRPAAGIIAVLAVAGGCTGAQPSPKASPSPIPSAGGTDVAAAPSATPDAVRADLDALVAALDRSHPDPFHGISRDDFAGALDAYAAALPGLSDDEAVVELMRTVALLSREGRDGHQFALPQPGHQAPVLPIRVYEFTEGLFITAAAPPNEALVGASITAIDGTPITDVLAAIEPLVPRDGPATVPAFRPIFLVRSEVLRGLGIIGDGPVELSIDHHGFESVATVEPITFDEYGEWAGGIGMHQLPIDERMRYLADPSPLSVELMGSALYVRYRSVVHPDMRGAREILDGGSVERLILDLRQNPGGDNTTLGRLEPGDRDRAAHRRDIHR